MKKRGETLFGECTSIEVYISIETAQHSLLNSKIHNKCDSIDPKPCKIIDQEKDTFCYLYIIACF